MAILFQVTLRRLVYLGIKEMANIAEDVIIVTSSLTKDMTGKVWCCFWLARVASISQNKCLISEHERESVQVMCGALLVFYSTI